MDYVYSVHRWHTTKFLGRFYKINLNVCSFLLPTRIYSDDGTHLHPFMKQPIHFLNTAKYPQHFMHILKI